MVVNNQGALFMPTYLDRALVLYPGIQGISYRSTTQEGVPLQDPYDGLVWNNLVIPKPSKLTLDLVTNLQVIAAQEIARKVIRNAEARKNLAMVAVYVQYFNTLPYPGILFNDYLDYIEQVQNSL